MGRGMRALTVLTIVMGVMILAGTGVLVAVIAHRIVSPAPGGAVLSSSASLSSEASTAAAAPGPVVLDEPAGTRIAGIAAAGDRLAVQLQGGGADRVVLVDPRSGAVTGRITLAR
jgi:hypothetical protein